MPYSILQGGRRRRRGGRPLAGAMLVVVLLAMMLALSPLRGGGGSGGQGGTPNPLPSGLEEETASASDGESAGEPRYATAPARDGVRIRFRRPPRSGLLFDLRTGEVLWSRNQDVERPIASLTKIMTAIVVADSAQPRDRVRITKEALNYSGSGMGVLRRGQRIPVETMLHGLLLASGNDAARALARDVGGSIDDFVERMNGKADELGLGCTRFSGADGLEDRGNHSCATDLALMARELLARPRLARIVKRRVAVLRYPIKGGRIFLYNHNPLLRLRYRGTTGVKTGYTDRAGRSLVATVKRGRRHLGVVLLHSPDPGKQAMQLFDRAFRK